MTDVPENPAAVPVDPVPIPGIPPAPAAENPGSAFDPLFVSPEEAARLQFAAVADRIRREGSPLPIAPDLEEKEEDAGELLSEAIGRITKAMEKLSKKGLNMRAVIALLHDANPSIPKKQIKAVLEGLRELPAIYGRDAAQR